MFELIGMGWSSFTAYSAIKLISAGLDIMTTLSIIAGLCSGVGAIGVAMVELIKRKLWKEGTKKVAMW